MSKHIEKFENVTIEYDKSTNYLYVNDCESGEQLAVFYVAEED